MTVPVKLKPALWLALASGVALGGYLAAARQQGFTGFPLDDAWIHQTYARSLGSYGEWAFLPGQPSAGSTAPLWSALLAAGHALRLGPYFWTYLAGWAALFAVALAGRRAFGRLLPEQPEAALWAGLFLAFEWHLVWAAGSGMETLLFAALILYILGSLLSKKAVGVQLGLVIGLSVWVRPDGVTLLGPALVVILLQESNWRDRLLGVARLMVGFALPVVPYLAFNRVLAGNWWPNTFFAKQAEYAVYRQLPLWERLLHLGSLPLLGPGVLLLPGLILALRGEIQRREWGALAGVVWLLGYLLLYAWRLPVTYQYGRYLMPAMPIFFTWSLAGMASFLQPSAPQALRRVVSRVWVVSLGAALLAFYVVGARAYARDVAIIETEMVAAARWVATHTPVNALIAAHDIGALGYFGERPLVDLAGLVSPEVIPIIRDEERIALFLDDHHVDYLMTFPGWYPHLVRRAALVFTTGGLYSPLAGGENMAVLRWMEP